MEKIENEDLFELDIFINELDLCIENLEYLLSDVATCERNNLTLLRRDVEEYESRTIFIYKGFKATIEEARKYLNAKQTSIKQKKSIERRCFFYGD